MESHARPLENFRMTASSREVFAMLRSREARLQVIRDSLNRLRSGTAARRIREEL
jgi:hypothetical protein